MKRTIVVVGMTLFAAACAKRFIVVSPDDPEFCERCPCHDHAPSCPLALGAGPRCTLGELESKFATDVSFASTPAEARLVRCGRYVLFREEGFDYAGEFAFDADSGALMASRTGGGYGYLICGGGYYANETKYPVDFVFPSRAGCVPLDWTRDQDAGGDATEAIGRVPPIQVR
jgi:hypothetical protein